MTSYLIDVNVWVALTWGLHSHHKKAAEWEQQSGRVSFLFCRLTMLSFVRLLTTKQLMGGSTMTIADALSLYEQWLGDERVEFIHEPPGISQTLTEILRSFGPQSAPKAVADCYLAALAESTGAHLVTFDVTLATVCRHRGIGVELLRPE